MKSPAKHMEEDTPCALERALMEGIKALETDELTLALERVRSAVRGGNVDALRAAYEGRGGFQVGLSAQNGAPEKMVLLEMLRTPGAPLELLRVFFRELGGRFWVDPYRAYGVCVYSMLIEIETTAVDRDIVSEEEARRWEKRMMEIVGYMVETLDMPLPCHSILSLNRLEGHLIDLAWHSSAWAAWAAFARYVPASKGQDAYGIMCRMAQWQSSTPYSDYWFGRYASDLTDEQLQALMHLVTDAECVFGPSIDAEAERRKTTRIDARMLFTLGCKERFAMPGDLMHKIQMMAYSDCRF